MQVQNSVFEGDLTSAQEENLKLELKNKIKPKEDKVMIYHLQSLKYVSKEAIGLYKEISDVI